jgi:hypothetical protein
MPPSDSYQESQTSGLYDSPVEDLLKLDKAVLANIDWAKDFQRDPHDKLRLVYTDRLPFTTLIFGEIAPSSMGTQHSASGNHYLGSTRKPVRFVFSCHS